MNAKLNDIRILKLAEMYEGAFERFVLEMAERVVKDDQVRRELLKLVDPTDMHHERIVAHLERLNAALTPEERLAVEIAAAEDCVEVERAARDFYLGHIDQLHDKDVIALFRALAHEEEQHLKIARRALERARGTAGHLPSGMPETRPFRYMPTDDTVPLREGVVDFGGGLADNKDKHHVPT